MGEGLAGVKHIHIHRRAKTHLASLALRRRPSFVPPTGQHTDPPHRARAAHPASLLAEVEWDTLLFFYGVIMCVGGLGLLGYLDAVAGYAWMSSSRISAP